MAFPLAGGGIQDEDQWVMETKQKIKDAFSLFDKEKKFCVIQEEVSTIMRYLGAFPTEKAMVKEILPEVQEDEPTSFVQYDRFEQKMLEILASHEWDPDPPDVILQAFRTLDQEGNGYIDAAKMKEMLVTKGTPFREKELDAFMTVAKDIDTARIYYEDYVALIGADLENK